MARSARCGYRSSILREHRLEVDDRRPVDRFQAPHMYAHPINAEDAYPMQANRVRSARCPGAEDPGLGSAQVAARMHPQHGPVSLVQPAQHDDLLADRNAIQARLNLGVQHQVRVRCAFIPLPRGVGYRNERTLDASNRAHREIGGGGVSHGKDSITMPSRNSKRVRH